MSYKCEECGKRYDNTDRLMKHVLQCNRDTASSTRSSSKAKTKAHNKHSISRVSVNPNEFEMLKNQNRQLQETLYNQNLEFSKQNAAMKEYYQHNIQTLQIDNTALREELRNRNSFENNHYTKELAQKNVEIAQIQQDLERYKQDSNVRIQNMTHVHEKQLQEIGSLHKKELTLQTSTLHTEIKRLKEQLEEQLVQHNKLMQKKQEELCDAYVKKTKTMENEYTKQISDLKHQIENQQRGHETELQNSKRVYMLVKQESDHALSRVMIVTKELNELKANHESELKNLRIANDSVVNSLQQRIQHLTLENKEYRSTIEEYIHNINTLQLERNEIQQKYHVEVNMHTNRLHTLESDYKLYKQKFKSEVEEARLRYERMTETKLATLDEMEKKIKEYEKLQVEYDALTRRFHESRKYANELSDQSRERLKQYQECNQKVAMLVEKNTHLEEQLKNAQGKCASFQRQLTLLQKEFGSMVPKLAQSEQCREESLLRLTDLQTRYDKIIVSAQSSIVEDQVLVSHLREELKIQRDKLESQDKLYETINSQSSELIRTRGWLDNSKSKLNQQQNEIERQVAEIKTLKETQEMYIKKNEELKNVLENTHAKVVKLGHNLENMQSQLRQTESERHTLRTSHATLTEQYTTTLKLYTQLQAKAQQYENDIHRITLEHSTIQNQYGQLKIINDNMAKTIKNAVNDKEDAIKRALDFEHSMNEYRKKIEKLKTERTIFENASLQNFNQLQKQFVETQTKLEQWETKQEFYNTLEDNVHKLKMELQRIRVKSAEVQTRLQEVNEKSQLDNSIIRNLKQELVRANKRMDENSNE